MAKSKKPKLSRWAKLETITSLVVALKIIVDFINSILPPQ